MEPETTRLALAAAAALVGGAGVGWWLRGRHHEARSVLLDELWTRKIRGHEAAAAEAGLRETQARSARAEAEASLAHERERAAELEHELERSRQDTRRLTEESTRQRTSIEDHERHAAGLDAELRTLREEHTALRRRHRALGERVRALEPLRDQLAQVEASLARAQEAATEARDEREAEAARLNAWIAELLPLNETLRERDAALEALREQEAALRSAHAEELRERDELLADRVTAQHKLERHGQRAREERDQEARRCKRLQGELRELEERVTRQAARTQELLQTRTALEGQLEDERQGGIQARLQVTDLEVRLTTEERARAAAEARLAELELGRDELARRQGELQERAERRRARAAELEEELASLRAKLQAREQELQRRRQEAELARSTEPSKPPATTATLAARGSVRKPLPRDPATTGDDLTELRGIGARLSERLHAAGIKSFQALADQDPEALASALGVPASRIERDGWIEAARARTT